VVRYPFEIVQLEELVSFTIRANVRSRHVMEKLGMSTILRTISSIRNFRKVIPFRSHILYRTQRYGSGGYGEGSAKESSGAFCSASSGSAGSIQAKNSPLTSSIADNGSSARS